MNKDLGGDFISKNKNIFVREMKNSTKKVVAFDDFFRKKNIKKNARYKIFD